MNNANEKTITFSGFPGGECSHEGTESLHTSSGRNEGINADDFDDFDDFAALIDSARILDSLGDSQNSYLERMFADSKMSAMSAGMFADSKLSAISAMSTDFDRMFLDDSNHTIDSMPFDRDDMRVDSIRAQEFEAQPNCNNNNIYNRRRRVTHPSPSMKRTQLKEVNFDPTLDNNQKFSASTVTSNNFSQPTPSPQPHPQVAMDTDVALILADLTNSHPQYRTALDSGVTHSLTSTDHPRVCNGTNSGGAHQEVSYEDALQKLADSMKRTERSRQQLMMQRALIGAESPQHPQPRSRTIESAQQILQQNVTVDLVSAECFSKHSPNDRASMLDAFLSGSRGTLTSGLERSRRQLKMHHDQMANNQTF